MHTFSSNEIDKRPKPTKLNPNPIFFMSCHIGLTGHVENCQHYFQQLKLKMDPFPLQQMPRLVSVFNGRLINITYSGSQDDC